MKNRLLIISVLCACVTMFACSSPQGASNISTAQPQSNSVVTEPELAAIQSICELATLECYYNNVAKATKAEGVGLMHLGEVERKFWIEYTGIAKIGIDMSQVQMSVDGQNVTIKMPPAKVLSYKVDSISEDGYIVSEDSWLNSNPITADEQAKAVGDAQEAMVISTESNPAIMDSAQRRAQSMIENYLKKIGDSVGVEYQITWEYIE